MGMIDSKHRIPTLAETNALKEAAKTGSLHDGGAAFRAELAKLQARLPSAPQPNVVTSPAETQFQSDLAMIAERTSDPELARALLSAFSYLAREK